MPHPWRATGHTKNSPIEAVAGSNAEALRATPEEKVIDAVRKHRPLDGVAMVPPGQADREGRIYKYNEGTDLMIEDGGNYKRWPELYVFPSISLSYPFQPTDLKHYTKHKTKRNTSRETSKAKANPLTPLKKPSKTTKKALAITAASCPKVNRLTKWYPRRTAERRVGPD